MRILHPWPDQGKREMRYKEIQSARAPNKAVMKKVFVAFVHLKRCEFMVKPRIGGHSCGQGRSTITNRVGSALRKQKLVSKAQQ